MGTFLIAFITPVIAETLLGIVIGVLSYTTIRHSIPRGARGKPIFFVVGALLYAMLIIIKWNLTGVI